MTRGLLLKMAFLCFWAMNTIIRPLPLLADDQIVNWLKWLSTVEDLKRPKPPPRTALSEPTSPEQQRVWQIQRCEDFKSDMKFGVLCLRDIKALGYVLVESGTLGTTSHPFNIELYRRDDRHAVCSADISKGGTREFAECVIMKPIRVR